MVNYQRLCPTLYNELAYGSERRQVEEATYHRVLGCSPALAGQLFQLSIWRHRGSHSIWTCVCVPCCLDKYSSTDVMARHRHILNGGQTG